MILLINGSLGVGKSSISDELLWKFEKAVHLDGDAIGNVHPFEIYDDARTLHLHRTLAMLVRFHRENGYPAFVINYIFENADQLTQLTNLLRPLDPEIHAFHLVCDEAEQAERIRRRNRDNLEWELKRYIELRRIQKDAAQTGLIGEEVDTTGLTAAQAAELIWQRVQTSAHSD